MKVLRGKNFNNPILLKRSEVDKNKMVMKVENFDLKQSQSMPSAFYQSSDSCIAFIDVLFGGKDYNYFIKNENTYKDEKKGTYKIYNVEDTDGINHSIFFLIEN
jgi:hypothetical protein